MSAAGQADRAGARPVTALAGVGPARAARLEVLGLTSLADLCLLVPRELEEVPGPVDVAAARAAVGSLVRVRGTVAAKRFFRQGGRRSLLRVKVEDGTGAIEALFFNQPWQRDHFGAGDEVELLGQVVATGSGPALATPRRGDAERPLPPPGHLEPVYGLTEGVGQDWLRGLVTAALEQLVPGRLAAHRAGLPAGSAGDEGPEGGTPGPPGPPDPTEDPGLGERLDPAELADVGAAGLPDLDRAACELRFPRSRAGYEAARRRVRLEGLLGLAARLVRRRRARTGGAARVVPPVPVADLAAGLPFPLTGAQARVVGEVVGDLATAVPTGRLLQGDVGSGKTAVAVLAAAAVAGARPALPDGTPAWPGAQVAVMAPTELLAEQHFAGQAPFLEGLGVAARLLTGSTPTAEARALLAELAAGRPLVVFGTHALFSTRVTFADLALVVVDEEHRFGVEQRRQLARKGRSVHRLSMTATPIPRSLARVLYGDLDLSVVDELPPGRGELCTRWVRGAERRKIGDLLEARLERGERAFWVLPRIEDGEGGRGAVTAAEWLRAGRLGRFGVELVHGRLSPDERRAAFARFRAGETKLLVGTTVIEVGVDVPEATVIVIEGAERLGLAQLHQLRGRVGRGGDAVTGGEPAWCLLLGPASAEERFRLLEATRDGFELAEADLAWRGMGDLTGRRQSGENAEGLAEFDARLFERALRLVDERDALLALYAPVADDASGPSAG